MFKKNNGSYRLHFLATFLFLTSLLLAACGDPTATSAPATTTVPVTSGVIATTGAGTTAAVTTAAAAQVKKGGTLKYGLSSDPSGLDPHIHTGAAPAIIKTLVYDTLTKLAADGKPQPWLAVSWENPDPKTFTFKLRSGVKWHDGSDFTADDVKFSFERIAKKETGATRLPDFSNIDTMEVSDPLTIKITLKQPDASFLAVLADVTSSIVSKKYVEAGNDLKTKMMGTGAFTFAARETGVKIEVKKNASFWIKEQPYLDGINFIMYPDDRARLSALQSGAVDFIDYVPWRSYDELNNSGNLAVYSKPATTSALYFNTTKPPFDNVKVRQAIAQAISPEAIAKAVFFGKAVPVTNGFLVPGTSFAEGQTMPYKYDLEKAKNLLAEAGYKGEEITLVTTSTYDFLQQTAEIIQGQLTQIGMKVKIESVDFTVFGQRFNKQEFNILTSSFGIGIPDPNYMNQLFAKGSLYGNRTGYVDTKVDDLLVKGRSLLNDAERAPIYRELNQYMLTQLPIVPIVLREEGEAGAKYVKGYVRYGAGVSGETNRSLLTSWLDK